MSREAEQKRRVRSLVDKLRKQAETQAATRVVVEARTDDPASPAIGQMWLRTDE